MNWLFNDYSPWNSHICLHKRAVESYRLSFKGLRFKKQFIKAFFIWSNSQIIHFFHFSFQLIVNWKRDIQLSDPENVFYSVGETILTTEKEIIQNLNIQRQQSKTGKIQKPVKVVLLYYPYIQHKFRGKTSDFFTKNKF